MRRFSFLVTCLVAGALVGGCQIGSGMRMVTPMPVAYPQKSPPPGMGGALLSEAGLTTEELQKNLAEPARPTVPMTVALLYRGFGPTLKPEDEQAAIAALTSKLQASGLVKTVTVMPPSLVGPTDDLDTLRKLASRFGANTLVLIAGGTQVQRSKEQPSGFFASFSNAVNMEADTMLTGLVVDVLSGRFLPPLEVIGQAGPTLVDPDAGEPAAARYALEKQAETQALDALATRFVDVAKAAAAAR